MDKFGFGCMRLPLLSEKSIDIDLKQFEEMVDLYLVNGFSYFDTAYRYHRGESENALRKVLVDRYPRDVYQLADKMPMAIAKSKEDVKKIFADQMNKLNVDHFDYYLLHNIKEDTYQNVLSTDGFSFLRRIKEEGLAKHVGFSFHGTPALLEEVLSKHHQDIEFVQLQINYLDWDSISIQAKKNYEIARKYDKKIFVMEPVKGGQLARLPEEAEQLFRGYDPDRSNASYALRFAAGLNGVERVLSGMHSLDQLQDNISFMKDPLPLNEKELALIEQVKQIIYSKEKIQCTACGYCVEGCPMKIAIPDMFDLYNYHHQQNTYELVLFRGSGKASDCIKCGACEAACPQHLKIRDYLSDLIVPKFEV